MRVSMRNILSLNSAYDSFFSRSCFKVMLGMNKHKITDREIISGKPLFAYALQISEYN